MLNANIFSENTHLFLVQEVQNYGGFFGGETLTLIVRAIAMPEAEEQTFTIDEQALVHVTERYAIVAGMLLALSFAESGRVERAELLAAATREELRQALGFDNLPKHLDGPLVISYRCEGCGLWVAGSPGERCPSCGQNLNVETADKLL